jgi:Flp pilus assembly protein TadD
MAESADVVRHHQLASWGWPPRSSDPGHATQTSQTALGLGHHRAGDLDAAERCYQAALAANPNHANAWHLLGLIACHCGRHDLALQHINHALKLKPNEPGFLLNLGVTFQALGRTAEAAEAFRQALDVKPDFVEALHCAESNVGVGRAGVQEE